MLSKGRPQLVVDVGVRGSPELAVQPGVGFGAGRGRLRRGIPDADHSVQPCVGFGAGQGTIGKQAGKFTCQVRRIRCELRGNRADVSRKVVVTPRCVEPGREIRGAARVRTQAAGQTQPGAAGCLLARGQAGCRGGTDDGVSVLGEVSTCSKIRVGDGRGFVSAPRVESLNGAVAVYPEDRIVVI